jgi:hypothetical protein
VIQSQNYEDKNENTPYLRVPLISPFNVQRAKKAFGLVTWLGPSVGPLWFHSPETSQSHASQVVWLDTWYSSQYHMAKSRFFNSAIPDVDVSRHRDLDADASFDNSHVRV